MYVTHGAKLTFTGHYGNPGEYNYGGWGWANSTNTDGSFSRCPIPEPLHPVPAGQRTRWSAALCAAQRR